MANNITGIINLGTASQYLIDYLLRALVGFTEPIYTVGVTTSVSGNLESTKASEIQDSLYIGPAQFSINTGYVLITISVPAEEAGVITEILLVAGDTDTGEIVLRVPLDSSLVKKAGFSLELRLKLRMTGV